MKPKISVLTFGVDDLERSVAFYRDGLGLHTEGIVGAAFEHGPVAFLHLEGGLGLSLWPWYGLAHAAGLDRSGSRPTDLSIGHNVSSSAEVDEAMEQAERAGATIV